MRKCTQCNNGQKLVSVTLTEVNAKGRETKRGSPLKDVEPRVIYRYVCPYCGREDESHLAPSDTPGGWHEVGHEFLTQGASVGKPA